MSVLPEELLAARDSVLYSNVGCGPLVNSTYTHYSPTFPNPLITFPQVIYSTLEHFNERYNNYSLLRWGHWSVSGSHKIPFSCVALWGFPHVCVLTSFLSAILGEWVLSSTK